MTRAPVLSAVVLLSLFGTACARMHGQWKDPSPHQTLFVTVDQDTRLEVLDWGGKGGRLR